MKPFLLCFFLIVVSSLGSATTATAQTLGLGGSSKIYDETDSLVGLHYLAYRAEVLFTEYTPNGAAQVFMSYAVYGVENGFEISLINKDSTTFQTWLFGESQRTGIVSFLVPQQEINKFLFRVTVFADRPWSMSEPLIFSSEAETTHTCDALTSADTDFNFLGTITDEILRCYFERDSLKELLKNKKNYLREHRREIDSEDRVRLNKEVWELKDRIRSIQIRADRWHRMLASYARILEEEMY